MNTYTKSSQSNSKPDQQAFRWNQCSVITGVTWKSVKPSPLAPLPQERGTRKEVCSPSPAGEGVGG